MSNAVYHYIENYSNVGKIGISFEAIAEMIKITIKDIEKFDISRSITCEVKEGNLGVNIPIKIHYGKNISEVTSVIQNKVETALKDMCEITNSKINVKVEGIVVK